MHRRISAQLLSVVPLLLSASHAAAEPVAAKVPPVEQLAQFKCVAFAVLGVLAAGLGLLALLGIYSVVNAQTVRRNGERLRQHTARGFLMGGVTALAAILSAMIAGILPEPLNGLCGLALLLSVAYMGVSGLCVVAHEVGDSVLSNLNSRYAGSSFAAVLTGGTLIGLSGLAVGIGQIFQLLALILGLGVFTSGLIARRRRPRATDPADAC